MYVFFLQIMIALVWEGDRGGKRERNWERERERKREREREREIEWECDRELEISNKGWVEGRGIVET